MRIVSLLPSATEIVTTLGLGESLVGISHDCDYPPEIRSRPVLSEAIVGPQLPSGLIESRIRGQVHRGKSVYHLDEGQLAQLHPDLILTQELCQVCAPSYSLVKQAVKVLEAETKIASLEPQGLADILDNITFVGELTGTAERASQVVGDLRRGIDQVRAHVLGRPRPSVVCLEWLDPLYVGGHWIPEMVDIAGGRDALAKAGEPSFIVDWDDVVEAAPEVIVVMPCGFDVARTRQEIGLLTGRRGWDALPAEEKGRVYLTDATSYFNRPGPRIVTGLEILAQILHPSVVTSAVPSGSVERL